MMFSNLRRGENGWIVDGVDGGTWKLSKVSGKNMSGLEAIGLYRLGGNDTYAQLYLYDGYFDESYKNIVKELVKRNMWISNHD